MKLRELRFGRSNGRSRISALPEGEEITFPLVRVDGLKLLRIQRNQCRSGESEEAFHRRMIELQSPSQAAYFARSEDHRGLYVGVQYYRAASIEDKIDDTEPVGLPLLLRLPDTFIRDTDIKNLIERFKPNGVNGYTHTREGFGQLAVVQYYFQR